MSREEREGPRDDAAFLTDPSKGRRRWLLDAAFFLLCLLAGSDWLIDEVWPRPVPGLLEGSLVFAMLAACAGGVILSRKGKAVLPSGGSLSLAAWSVVTLALPTVLLEASHGVARASGAALYTLVPLLMCVLIAAFAREPLEAERGRRTMMPGLIAAFGGLILLPWSFPGTARETLNSGIVLAAVLLVTTGSFKLHTRLRGSGLLQGMVLIGMANAILLSVAAGLRGELLLPSLHELISSIARAIVCDVPQLVLLCWLLREASPLPLTTRFLLVPVISIVEGAVALHMPLRVRFVAGILLLLVGAFALLLWEPGEEAMSASLFKPGR